jgi:hypothetical protein
MPKPDVSTEVSEIMANALLVLNDLERRQH